MAHRLSRHNVLYLTGAIQTSCVLDPSRMAVLEQGLLEHKDSGTATIIVVERIQDLVKLQAIYLSGMGVFRQVYGEHYILSTELAAKEGNDNSNNHNHNDDEERAEDRDVAVFLECQSDWKREGARWTHAVSSRRPLFTTSMSLLHALLHGFVNLAHVGRLIILDAVPDVPNQHPLCNMMSLFYWPLLGIDYVSQGRRHQHGKAPKICGFVYLDKTDATMTDVFKRHQWAGRLRHYWHTFDAHVANTNDAEHLCGIATGMECDLFRRVIFSLGDSADESAINASSVSAQQLAADYCSSEASYSVINASPKYIARFVGSVIEDSTESPLDGTRSSKIGSIQHMRQVAESIGYRYQRAVSNPLISDMSPKHHRMPSGALLEPSLCINVLLRFCSLLPRQSGCRGLSVRVVPVRRLDALRKPLDDPEQETAYFAGVVLLPERLSAYMHCRIVGPAMLSRHEAQCEAAFVACKCLLERGLLDEHLLISDQLLHAEDLAGTPDEEGKTSAKVGDDNSNDDGDNIDDGEGDEFVITADVDDAIEAGEGTTGSRSGRFPMSELIPNTFQASPGWRGRCVYALEWEWKSPDTSASHTLPIFTRWLRGAGDYMDTRRGPFSFALVLKEPLPVPEADLPPIFIPTGAYEGAQLLLENGLNAPQQGFFCRLKRVGNVVLEAEEGHDRLMAMQSRLFSFLNVRPLFVDELFRGIGNGGRGRDLLDKPWIPYDKRAVYMLAPIIREGFDYEDFSVEQYFSLYNSLKSSSAPSDRLATVDYSDRQWRIDWKFMERLCEKMSVADVLEELKGYSNVADADVFAEYCLRQALLTTPYNRGATYRLRKLYTDLTPYSPFESKVVPEARNYWEYVKLRYGLEQQDGVADEAPLLGVGRVENFADISQWTLCEPDEESDVFLTTSMASDKKRLKKCAEHHCCHGTDGSNGPSPCFAVSSLGTASSAAPTATISSSKIKASHALQTKTKTALIPQLTFVAGIPYAAIRALLMVPRIVDELEAQLLALDFYSFLSSNGYIPDMNGSDANNSASSNLADDIAAAQPIPRPFLLVSSLTSITAMQLFSYERLEVLGDSILKAAVSIDAFLNNGHAGEGKLSAIRMSKINNAVLFRLGRSLGIYKYAHVTIFSSKLWTPPCLNPPVVDPNGIASSSDKMEWAQTQRLFDPEFRWKLLSDLEKRRADREAVYDYIVSSETCFDIPSLDGCDAHANASSSSAPGKTLSRRGQMVAAKMVADLVEASIGAVYGTLGWGRCVDYLHRLGIVDNDSASVGRIAAATSPLDLLGSLIGDPRDRIPLRSISKDWSKPLLAKPFKATYGGAIVETMASGSINSNSSGTPRNAKIIQVDYDGIEERMGYRFRQRKLLLAAMTHVSIDPIYCNERLEWLGDALIDWAVTKTYYHCSRELSPFELTEARKATVNNVALSGLSVKLLLHESLRISSQSLEDDIARYVQYFCQSTSHAGLSAESEECLPPKVLGDVFEALIGAVFLDTRLDLEETGRVIARLMHPLLARYTNANTNIPVSAVSRCLEAYARMGLGPGDLQIIFCGASDSASGDNDAAGNRKICRVLARGKVVGESVVLGKDGKTPRARALAKERAAQAALDCLLTHGSLS